VEGTISEKTWFVVAYKRAINCTNVAELRNIGTIPYYIRGKRKN
jgi:hypothetical protein